MRLRILSLPLFLLLTGCETLAKVDKGLYGVADTVAKPDVVTGERTANFASREAQIESGDGAVHEFIGQFGGRINKNVDAKAYARLEAVFRKIHSVSHYRSEKWTPVLVPDPSFNAFVTGGTYVVVNIGLFSEINSDDELAAVLGHEIAHVSANHISEKQAALVTRSLRKRSEKTENLEIAFTVGQESEADRIGILYAALAGYDPYAASQLWGRLFKKMGNNGGMMNSHPMNSQRGEEARLIASKVEQYYKRNQINPQFASILEGNPLWQRNENDKEVVAGEGGGLLAVASATLNTMTSIQNAKQEQAQQSQRIELIRAVSGLLKVTGLDVLGPSTFGIQYQYIGNVPLQNLVLKTEYGSELLVFHSQDIIQPGQAFIAVFNTSQRVQKGKIQATSFVDSVELAM